MTNASRIFRFSVNDTDTDGDGVMDWEEFTIGFNPYSSRTDRSDLTDSQRLATGLTNNNVISA